MYWVVEIMSLWLQPQVITVVLKVHMHCEACAQEIKKRIERMKGDESNLFSFSLPCTFFIVSLILLFCYIYYHLLGLLDVWANLFNNILNLD